MCAVRVHVFDANPADLRGRESQLRFAGLDHAWELLPTGSRNELLVRLRNDARSSPRLQSVCLIDYRTESDDLEQTGFRIVETIRRHEYLWKATRPIIWVDILTRANTEYAQGVAPRRLSTTDGSIGANAAMAMPKQPTPSSKWRGLSSGLLLAAGAHCSVQAAPSQ